jgi:hypothetical protein
MKCHEAKSKIVQIDDDSPAAEIIVHARECAACNQSLREVLWQQKWLRERFAELSDQLLAHAPPLWGAAFQERLKGPALPAPLLPVAWAGGSSGGRRSRLVDVDNFHDELVQILRRRTARSARIRRKTDSKR